MLWLGWCCSQTDWSPGQGTSPPALAAPASPLCIPRRTVQGSLSRKSRPSPHPDTTSHQPWPGVSQKYFATFFSQHLDILVTKTEVVNILLENGKDQKQTFFSIKHFLQRIAIKDRCLSFNRWLLAIQRLNYELQWLCLGWPCRLARPGPQTVPVLNLQCLGPAIDPPSLPSPVYTWIQCTIGTKADITCMFSRSLFQPFVSLHTEQYVCLIVKTPLVLTIMAKKPQQNSLLQFLRCMNSPAPSKFPQCSVCKAAKAPDSGALAQSLHFTPVSAAWLVAARALYFAMKASH